MLIFHRCICKVNTEWGNTNSAYVPRRERKNVKIRRASCLYCTFLALYETLCAIWYHLYNLENVKNFHGGVLFLVKLKPCNFTYHSSRGAFQVCLNCTNGTKSRKASHIFNDFRDVNLESHAVLAAAKSSGSDTFIYELWYIQE